MIFSSTTDKNGAIQFIESLCKLGDGGITNDTTLFKQITSYYNQSAKKVASALMRVDKNWKIDDSNYTDFPIASINLVLNQRDYTLPASASGGNYATLYRINKIKIMDLQGNYQEIKPFYEGEVEETTNGFPTSYRLVGGSIRFNYLPSSTFVTLTAGLQIEFQRAWDEFTTSDTTQQLPFQDSWHQAVCYDTSSTYLLPVNRDLALDYRNIYKEMVLELQKDHNRKDENSEFSITGTYIDPR